MGAPGYTNDDVVMHGGLSGSRFRGAMSTPRSSSPASAAR
jgi:hypothetical protein